MRIPSFKIFGWARCLLIWIFIMLAFKSTLGFWPFSDNTVPTPTLKFYPEPPEADRGSSLIYYKQSDFKSSQTNINSINNFLKMYKDTKYEENSMYCDFDSPHISGKFCVFRPEVLGPCSAERNFGFSQGRPCIFLTLSKVENWIPTVYNESDINFLNEKDTFSKMPLHIRYQISSQQSKKKYVYVSCEGDTAFDAENIGPIVYYPYRGFPAYYFPFTSVEGYQTPIVAVALERPTNGVVVSIVCKLWAKNIELSEEKEIGFTRIHLLID